MKTLCSIVTFSLGLACAAHAAHAEQAATRPPAPSLTQPKGAAARTDARGFIHRWLVLEPVPVSGRLTDPAVKESLQAAPLAGGADTLPRDGEELSLANTSVKWHALETLNYNVNLYHFAYALSKPTSNVLFWAMTVVEAPRDLTDVRLAVGSNAASIWWLNDAEVIALYNDRQSVIDDGVSRRVTLKRGANVIRAAVVNGGGATDFCARLLDKDDRPITGLPVVLPTRP